MSDAQVPPEILGAGEDPGDRSSETSEGTRRRVGDADMSRSDARSDMTASVPDRTGDTDTPVIVLMPAQPEREEELAAGHEVPIEDAAFTDAPGASEAAGVESDLGAPEIVSTEGAMRHEPAPDESSELHADIEDPEPAGADEAPSVPPSLAEVSPILSALDAAERASETAAHPASVPEPDDEDAARRLEAELIEAAALSGSAPDERAPEAPDEAPDKRDAAAEATSGAGDGTAPGENRPEQRDDVLHEAAARIAAEATATAAALENLKRLLEHKLPEPSFDMPPPPRAEARAEPPKPPPVAAYRPPVQVPISPPPMMPAADLTLEPEMLEPPRRPRPVGSFFAGFALSWVVGAVLYVVLNAG